MTASAARRRLVAVTRLAVNRRLVDSRFGVAYLERRETMRPLLPSRASDVFIDGFPRSANSYVFYAVRLANPDARVSGHCHSAAAVRRALELGVPTMLLVREPASCVASLVQFVPGLSILDALRHYRRFHRRVLALRRPYVVATFDEVTADLGEVMRRFNAELGTALVAYEKTDANEQQVRSTLQHTNARYADGQENTAALPSTTRRAAPDVMSHLDHRERAALADCRSLYAEVLGRR